jgi:hypothetical protein
MRSEKLISLRRIMGRPAIEWLGIAGLALVVVCVQPSAAQADGESFPSEDCGTNFKMIADAPAQIVSHKKERWQDYLAISWGLASSTVTMAISSVTATTVCLDNAGAYLLAQRQRQEVFAQTNALAISQGLAQGGNEETRVLANLMGCPRESEPRLASLAQDHYSEIIQTADPDGTTVMNALRRVVRVDAELSQRCAWI